MTIDQVEKLLHRMREQEAAEARDRLAQLERERQAEAAEKAAEDARLRSEWWSREKASRLRVIVPPSVHISHFEFRGESRRLMDHRGTWMRGAELVPVEIEDGQRVLYVRTIGDFKTICRNAETGSLWRNANPRLTEQMLATLPKNEPELPAPYEEPALR